MGEREEREEMEEVEEGVLERDVEGEGVGTPLLALDDPPVGVD